MLWNWKMWLYNWPEWSTHYCQVVSHLAHTTHAHMLMSSSFDTVIWFAKLQIIIVRWYKQVAFFMTIIRELSIQLMIDMRTLDIRIVMLLYVIAWYCRKLCGVALDYGMLSKCKLLHGMMHICSIVLTHAATMMHSIYKKEQAKWIVKNVNVPQQIHEDCCLSPKLRFDFVPICIQPESSAIVLHNIVQMRFVSHIH